MLYLSYFLLSIQITLISSVRQLKFVHVVYRHGSQAPEEGTFPNDPYGESFWPQGWERLTKIGMQEHFELGQFLRHHYTDQMQLLSPDYIRNEIYIRSTNVDRALQSAYCNLAGLYPPSNAQTFNRNISWQPIPVHCDEKQKKDRLLRPSHVDCPLYDQLDKASKKALTDQYNSKYQSFFNFIANKTGLKTVKLAEAGALFDTLYSEQTEGLTLPAWTTAVWNNGSTVMQLLHDMRLVSRLDEFSPPLKAKALAGYILGDILERMQDFSNHKLKKPTKMMVYATGLDCKSRNNSLSAILHCNMAASHMMLQNFESALQDCTATLTLYSQHERAYIRGCECLMSMHQLQKAQDWLNNYAIVITEKYRDKLYELKTKIESGLKVCQKENSGNKKEKRGVEQNNNMVKRSLMDILKSRNINYIPDVDQFMSRGGDLKETVHLDGEGLLRWNVLVRYPGPNLQDTVKDFAETGTFGDLLHIVLGKGHDGLDAQVYSEDTVVIQYKDLTHVTAHTPNDVTMRTVHNLDMTLGDILSRSDYTVVNMQPLFYVVPK